MNRLLVVMMLSLFAAPALAQSTVVPSSPTVHQDEERAVRVLLSAIHELPPRQQFEDAASNPYLIVRSLAAGRGPIADRALEAMFLWPNEMTFSIATAELGDGTSTPRRVHKLLMLLSTNYRERSTPYVLPFLGSAEARVRVTAAAAVAQIRTADAFTALDAAIAMEKDHAAATQMRRYARRIR